MRKILAAVLAVVLAVGLCKAALSEKARNIVTVDDEMFHDTHLLIHLNDTTCRVTGNYIKVRTNAKSNASLVGHLEQADTFVLLQVKDSFAYIRVLHAHESSPDSRDGMEGWVNAAYVDCTCSETAYRSGERDDDCLTGGYFPVGMPSTWYFASGAGGWSTDLTIMEDGSFVGYYHDWDGGGDDAYPQGVLEECRFIGSFSETEQISAYEFRVVVASLVQEGTRGDTSVRDGMLVTVGYPYGIGEGDSFILYMPGAPMNRIPPAYHEWASVAGDEWHIRGFALYNMTAGLGWNEN